MAHGGQEIALGPVGGLGLLFGHIEVGFPLFQFLEHHVIRPVQAGGDDGLVYQVKGRNFKKVTQLIRAAINICIRRKSQFRKNGQKNGGKDIRENSFGKMFPPSIGRQAGNQQDPGNHVFAHGLERGDAKAFDITGREYSSEYGGDYHSRQRQIHGRGPAGMQTAIEKDGGNQQRQGFKVTRSDPERGGGIGCQVRKYPHSLESKGVDHIHHSGSGKGDTQEEDVIVSADAPGVPGDQEHAARDDDAEQFRQAVKQQEIVSVDDPQAD